MKIVSRSDWGAKPPRNKSTTTWSRRSEFVVHHSEGPESATVRSIQDFHMGPARGWSDIAYSFLVRDDGTIYEGRGWLTIGAHATGHNTSGIGVCYIGYNHPTNAAKDAIRDLYDLACDKAGRTLIKRGHGQLSGNSTDCPGSSLLAWVKAGMPGSGPAPSPVPVPPGVPAFSGRVLVSTDPEMHGSDVYAWQRQMKARGWNLVPDSYYGSASEKVCRKFQEEKHLTVDGKVGALTWAATWDQPIT